jgi:membrane-bound lytic murein transglycosylase D
MASTEKKESKLKVTRVVLRIAPLLVLAACARTAPTIQPTPVPGPVVPTAAAAPLSQSPADTVAVSPAEVAKQAVAVFGDSVGVPPDSVEVEAEGEAEELTWDLDVRSYETHARVEHYVTMFSTEARSRIVDRLERGSRYEPMIRAKLKAAGLPEDMYYLALIESGYSPDAYSRAAAVGIWQFMTATAKGTGLRVDWWVDERRHPTRSTTAAVRHLSWLKDQFGSLYLAAAAYNGGSGRVSRGLTRYADELEGASGEDVFFALAEQDYLRKETKDYVPQLIAAALVGKDPSRYGLELRRLPPFEYDSVRVGPSVPLAAVANATTTDLKELGELNTHILRGVTPPKDSLWINVPVGRADGFADALRTIPSVDLTPYSRVKSKKGETFVSVARRVGITSKQLAWYNPSDGRKRGALSTGTTILVPSSDVLRAARDVPDPAIEIYGSSAVRHIVRKGETLSGIARRYRTTVPNLKRLNRLRRDAIFAGQSIRIR